MKELIKHVEDFDNGKEVKTVEMGGISDDYEIAIQKLAIEIMRIIMHIKVPKNQKDFIALLDNAERVAFENVKYYGYSGAQVGAAKNLAAVYYKQTPSKALLMMNDLTRIIIMSKSKSGQVTLSKKID